MIDIHETDPETGYSVERHMLDELRAAGREGLSASDLAYLLGDVSSAAVGQWLRDLRVRGLVVGQRVSPGSTRVRWQVA
jgi:DNA-binding transcriptional ArsR family regulator